MFFLLPHPPVMRSSPFNFYAEKIRKKSKSLIATTFTLITTSVVSATETYYTAINEAVKHDYAMAATMGKYSSVREAYEA